MGTHIFFTLYLRLPQKHLLRGIKDSVNPEMKSTEHGISPFAALSTMLAATLGTGNIIGVSSGVALGGPGAVFWCFLTGVLGMATSYAECFLSLQFRTKDGGGPMYVLRDGLKSKFWGNFYALLIVFAAFGMGCAVQSNSVAVSVHASFHISPHITGIVLSVITGLVIMGGIKSIGKVCSKVVPAITFLYLGSCVYLLILNHSVFLDAISLIFKEAFSLDGVGGGLVGSTFILAARYGVSRGLFSNEAGIGTSAIGAASSASQNMTREAYIFMTAPFWDTVVMCMLTGLVIVTSMLYSPESMANCSIIGLTAAAFHRLPIFGSSFISISLIIYAITTLIGWSYFGEQGTKFLFGKSKINMYKLLFLLIIYFGAITPVYFVWETSDLINALLILPNLIALYFLRKEIKT
jgi:AGCS family alanine or glycine:cation symporter